MHIPLQARCRGGCRLVSRPDFFVPSTDVALHMFWADCCWHTLQVIQVHRGLVHSSTLSVLFVSSFRCFTSCCSIMGYNVWYFFQLTIRLFFLFLYLVVIFSPSLMSTFLKADLTYLLNQTDIFSDRRCPSLAPVCYRTCATLCCPTRRYLLGLRCFCHFQFQFEKPLFGRDYTL